MYRWCWTCWVLCSDASQQETGFCKHWYIGETSCTFWTYSVGLISKQSHELWIIKLKWDKDEIMNDFWKMMIHNLFNYITFNWGWRNTFSSSILPCYVLVMNIDHNLLFSSILIHLVNMTPAKKTYKTYV